MRRGYVAIFPALLLFLVLTLALPLLAQEATESAGATATVTTGKLNVRSMPSAISQILTKIDEHETYPIVGRNNSGTWWQINVNGVIGWVNASYVDAKNTESVPITFFDLSHTPEPPTATLTAAPPVATVETTPEATAAPIENTPAVTDDAPVVITPEATVSLCSGAAFFFDNTTPDLCATGPVTQVQASIQSFENGTMLLLADSGDIYVFGNRGVTLVSSAIYDNLATPEPQTPPEGRLAPADQFGRVWANIAGVRDDLGWATSSVSSYQAAIQPGVFNSTGEKVVLILLRTGGIVAADPATSMWYTVSNG